MPIFFNNCQRRPHAAYYGSGAFYDLGREGAQAGMATNLPRGQECVVATPTASGRIEFGWFSFTHEKIMEMPDEPGSTVRVFFGEALRLETLSRSDAAEAEPYSIFFNVNGHFKRPSVLKEKAVSTRK